MAHLDADSRYILLKPSDKGKGEQEPFATARCVDVGEAGEDPVFDQISLYGKQHGDGDDSSGPALVRGFDACEHASR